MYISKDEDSTGLLDFHERIHTVQLKKWRDVH